MKRLGLVLFALAVLGLAPVAQAAPVTLDLNCRVVNPGDHTYYGAEKPVCSAASPSYGTITLADNGGNDHYLDITVDLLAPWNEVTAISLNYSGSNSDHSWSLTDGSSVNYHSNDKDPWEALDLYLNPQDTATPHTWTLKLYNTDLDPADFLTKDQYGVIYAAAEIGQCEWTWVGSTSEKADPVPEPASMTLLGTGLIGLAGAVRRRMKK